MAVAEQERETVRAQARFVHSSARKARLVTDLIRGRSVPEARTILAFSNRAVANDVEKVLRSAVANAESRPDLHWAGDELVVAVAYADEGPTLKRWRARARGRVARIRKRTCHITIELAQGSATSTAASVPAMAAPEPVEEPEVVEEPETVDEAEVEETEPRQPTSRPLRRRPKSRQQRRRPTSLKPRRRPLRRVTTSGPEDPSGRAPRGRDPRLEVQLVHRQEGVRGLHPRGRSYPRAHLQQARARGPVRHPDPQGQAADHGRHLHGAAGDRHRQVRCRGRRAAARPACADAEERPHQHQRDQAAGARCEARRAVDRRAALEPRRLPARDEARARVGDPLGRGRREDPVLWPPRRRRDEPARDVQRGTCAAAHDPRGHRLRLRRGEDDGRPDRRQGLDQQGRDHAGGLRHRRRAAGRPGHAAPPRRCARGSRRFP